MSGINLSMCEGFQGVANVLVMNQGEDNVLSWFQVMYTEWIIIFPARRIKQYYWVAQQGEQTNSNSPNETNKTSEWEQTEF